MRPIDFPEANFTFFRPPDMTDEECSDLKVHVLYKVFKGPGIISEEGIKETNKVYTQIISCWELNLEDLNHINNGGKLWLIITSDILPPVSIETEYPFINL